MEEEREPESLHVGSWPIVEDGVDSQMGALDDPVNEERAIVLYKPRMPSSPSITVNLDSLNLVSGFKSESSKPFSCLIDSFFFFFGY